MNTPTPMPIKGQMGMSATKMLLGTGSVSSRKTSVLQITLLF